MSLASAGVFAAVLAVGSHISFRVLSRAFKTPPVALFAPLAISLGLLVVTPLLLICAILGIYAPPVVGLIGWVVTLVIRFRCPGSFPEMFRQRTTLLLLAIALTGALVAFCFGGEHLYGGRDQGFYTNLAIWMANHGTTVVDFPFHFSNPAQMGTLGPGFGASGLYLISGHLISQFSHAYPIWLSQAYAVAGYQGMDAFNGFLAATSILLFYPLARTCMRPWPALLATAFLAFSPAQLWISRITLSELLAQQAFLAMSLLVVWAVRRKSPQLMLAAGLSGGFVFLARIDGMLVIPPLLIGTALAFLVGDRSAPAAEKLFWKLCIGTMCAFAACLAYYWIDTRPYFVVNIGGVPLVILLAVAACFMGLLIRPEFAVRLRPLTRSPYPRAILITLLVGLFAWAYFVRPQLGLVSETFRSLGSHEATRAFRANSLWNLGQYLSPVLLFASVGGLAWFVLSRRMLQRLHSVIPFVVVWLEFALFFIQDPRISADHPWAIRRFVPVVLPGFIFFAFLLVDRIEAFLRGRISLTLVRLAVALPMFGFLYFATPPSMFRREFAGSREFLADLASHVPSDVPVFAHGSLMWTLPLRMAFDKPVFVLNLNTKKGRRAATEIAEELSDGRCVVIHDKSFPKLSDPGGSMNFMWTIDRIRPSPYPLARTWIEGSLSMAIDRVNDSTVLIGVQSPKLGGQQVPGVSETGFWGQEYEGSRPFRWTRALATLGVPVEQGTSPRSLRIHYQGIHPEGADVVITVNNHRLFAKRVTDPAGSIIVDGLEGAEIGDRLDLSIESTPFRPVDFGQGADDRELGMRITYIEIIDDSD